jgi:hypothetical protein
MPADPPAPTRPSVVADAHARSAADVAELLDVALGTGLSAAEADLRRSTVGPNELEAQ